MRQIYMGGSSHPEGNKLVEHVEDVWIEVLREEQRLQRRAVPLNLLREDMIWRYFGLNKHKND